MTTTPAPSEHFEYWAFISYSHRDEKFCGWLHRGLDSYRTPQPLVGQVARDGSYTIPKKLYPIFRDREELAAGASLNDAITNALKNARYLVVICSPNSAQSYWVNEEVRYFESLGREKYILPIILNGEPNAKEGLEECFPPALRLPKEPIAADAREEKDGYDAALMKLRAGLLGVGLEDLVNRELQRQKKQARRNGIIAIFMLLLTVLAVAGGWLAWEKQQEADAQQKEAVAQKKESEHNYGLALAEKADRAFTEKRINEAHIYAAHALARIDKERSGDAEAFRALVMGARLGHTGIPFASFKGHDNWVESAVLSPNGKILASASSDVRLWDVATGKQLAHLMKDEGAVLSVAFSPDGKLLASGSSDVRLWDVATGKQLIELIEDKNGVNSVVFSPDGKTLASGSWDGTIRLWDVATGKQLAQSTGHLDRVRSIIFAPDGKTLASGSDDKTVRLWDVGSGKSLALLTGHEHPVQSVAFSPDGKMIASGGEDNTIRLWDAVGGKQLAQLTGHGDKVRSVSFSPDGKMLASGGDDKTIRLWSASGAQQIALLKGHEGGIRSLSFSVDGQTLISGSEDKTARLWNVGYGKRSAPLVKNEYMGKTAFSPDGKVLASIEEDKTIRLSDVASGKQLVQLIGHEGWVWGIAFSPDGKMLVSAGRDKTVRLWDVATGKQLAQLIGHEDWFGSVSFSPDGKTLASEDGHVERQWSLDDLFVSDWKAQAAQDEKRYGFKLKGLKLIALDSN